VTNYELTRKLVVNQAEAEQAREVFATFMRIAHWHLVALAPFAEPSDFDIFISGPEMPAMKITLTINGQKHSADVEPRLLLIHYLRDNAGLTGSHIGCETSLCGACTIDLDGKAVKSCSIFAAQADGANITTIEGLAADGKLHAMQEAFWNQHGLQCGFCTPGMIMACKQLLDRNPQPTDEEIRHGIEGNLCRCTGYQHIVNSVKAAAAATSGR